MREGETFRELKKNRVSCKDYRWGGMVASSIHFIIYRTHIPVLPQTRGGNFGGGVTETYRVSFP